MKTEQLPLNIGLAKRRQKIYLFELNIYIWAARCQAITVKRHALATVLH